MNKYIFLFIIFFSNFVFAQKRVEDRTYKELMQWVKVNISKNHGGITPWRGWSILKSDLSFDSAGNIKYRVNYSVKKNGNKEISKYIFNLNLKHISKYEPLHLNNKKVGVVLISFSDINAINRKRVSQYTIKSKSQSLDMHINTNLVDSLKTHLIIATKKLHERESYMTTAQWISEKINSFDILEIKNKNYKLKIERNKIYFEKNGNLIYENFQTSTLFGQENQYYHKYSFNLKDIQKVETVIEEGKIIALRLNNKQGYSTIIREERFFNKDKQEIAQKTKKYEPIKRTNYVEIFLDPQYHKQINYGIKKLIRVIKN